MTEGRLSFCQREGVNVCVGVWGGGTTCKNYGNIPNLKETKSEIWRDHQKQKEASHLFTSWKTRLFFSHHCRSELHSSVRNNVKLEEHEGDCDWGALLFTRKLFCSSHKPKSDSVGEENQSHQPGEEKRNPRENFDLCHGC